MAKEAYDKVPLLLSDGTEVILKPLNISRLKRFMKEFNVLKDIDLKENEFATFDIYVTCSGICLEPDMKDQFEKLTGARGEALSKEYREYLEDVLDMDTILKILEVCAGISFDPEALRLGLSEETDGTI